MSTSDPDTADPIRVDEGREPEQFDDSFSSLDPLVKLSSRAFC
jgi:hypothetical protein